MFCPHRCHQRLRPFVAEHPGSIHPGICLVNGRFRKSAAQGFKTRPEHPRKMEPDDFRCSGPGIWAPAANRRPEKSGRFWRISCGRSAAARFSRKVRPVRAVRNRPRRCSSGTNRSTILCSWSRGPHCEWPSLRGAGLGRKPNKIVTLRAAKVRRHKRRSAGG
jgi:hypothetical protein